MTSVQNHEKPFGTPSHLDAKVSADVAALRTIFDHLPMVVFWKDTQFRHRGHNPMFRRILGLADDQNVFGLTDADLMGETDAVRQYRAHDRKVLETGEPMLNVGETVLSQDGVEMALLTSKVPIRAHDGEIIGLVGVAFDITEQKRAQSEVESLRLEAERQSLEARRQEGVLRSVLESIPNSVFWKDRNCVYEGGNESFAKLAGVGSAAELVGRDDFACGWTPEEARACRSEDREVMASGRPMLQYEKSCKEPGGRSRTFLTSKVPLRDADDQVMGVLGILGDITERKEAELERAELQNQLLEASRQAGKAEVATGVLHNVGNALNSIGVGVELLDRQAEVCPISILQRLTDTLEPHRENFVAFVQEDARAKRLPQLLTQICSAMRREREELQTRLAQLHEQVQHAKVVVASQQTFAGGHAPAVSEAIAAHTLIEDAARIALAGRTCPNLRLKIQPAPAKSPPRILVDRHLVLQVLVNLVNNACQATSDGSPEAVVELDVRFAADGSTACFNVKDNGCGISAEVLPRLFEHGFTTRKEGHGFGLHTAALAAESMGGRLEAHSEGIGHGSRFSLTVPVKPAGVRPGRAA